MAKTNEQKIIDAFKNNGTSHLFNSASFARQLSEQDHFTQFAFYQSMISFITYKGLLADSWGHELDQDTIMSVCQYLRDHLENYFPEVKLERMANMNMYL